MFTPALNVIVSAQHGFSSMFQTGNDTFFIIITVVKLASLYTFVLSIVRKSVQEQVTVISLAPHSQRQGQAFLQKSKHLLVVFFGLQILKAFKSPSKRVLLSTLRDQSSTMSLCQGIKVLFDLY